MTLCHRDRERPEPILPGQGSAWYQGRNAGEKPFLLSRRIRREQIGNAVLHLPPIFMIVIVQDPPS
jgi:hypothetical protein